MSVVSAPPPLQSGILTIMTQAAFKAARGLVRDFGEVEQLQVSRKGPGNLTSNADLRAEKTIHYELMKGRPQYSYLMEESGFIQGENPDYRWIVDPLDGTNNFLHGMPHYAISIALEKQGDIVAGVIYDPLRNELFCAEKGYGAYMNDRRMRVSARRDFQNGLVSVATPSSPEHQARYFHTVAKLTQQRITSRHMGSAALNLAYLACGRLDAVWEPQVQLWDAAAGILMVQEAGGKIMHPSSEGWPGEVLASTQHLFTTFEDLTALPKSILPTQEPSQTALL